MAIAFRASGPIEQVRGNLGLLEELPGTFIGSGFNLIARPDKHNNKPFFLELNATHEILQFIAIGGDIPNRGSMQDDVNLHGVRYLQQVSDCTDHSQIHIEPGLWLHVPQIQDPPSDEAYVRQALIPHGDSVLAQSTFFTRVNGGPQIAAVNSTPFTDDQIPDLNADPTKPVDDPEYLAPFGNTKLPAECCRRVWMTRQRSGTPLSFCRRRSLGRTLLRPTSFKSRRQQRAVSSTSRSSSRTPMPPGSTPFSGSKPCSAPMDRSLFSCNMFSASSSILSEFIGRTSRSQRS